jgi:hypothetical protein
VVNLGFKAAKAGFFDREKVLGSLDRATRKVLSRFGAFVRTRARTSIRRRKGTSPAGRPPYSHVGLLRNLIFFAYDFDKRAVVIGPVLINSPTGAPENLEYGGDANLPIAGGRTRRVTIQPRPFMGPALDAELPGLPAMWQDSVR